MRRYIYQKGFTLVELLVVIAILGILATIVVLAGNEYVKRAAETSLKTDLSGAGAILEREKLSAQAYPATLPSSVKSSDKVTLTYSSTGGTSFCLQATHSTYTTLKYYITNKMTEPTSGDCPVNFALTINEPCINLTLDTPGINPRVTSPISGYVTTNGKAPGGNCNGSGDLPSNGAFRAVMYVDGVIESNDSPISISQWCDGSSLCYQHYTFAAPVTNPARSSASQIRLAIEWENYPGTAQRTLAEAIWTYN